MSAARKLSVGVVGATGHSGGEICRLLLNHPDVAHITPSANQPDDFDRIHPNLSGSGLRFVGHQDLIDSAPRHDAIFFCTPTGTAMAHAGLIVDAGVAVIDLSADFRFADVQQFEVAHGQPHTDPATQRLAVAGLTEHNREALKTARLVANPGCYVTAAVLGLDPLLAAGLSDLSQRIVVHAENGTTGAGNAPSKALMHSEAYGTVLPYNLDGHRHATEIDMHLARAAGAPVPVDFSTAHGPYPRGIHAAISGVLAPGYESARRQDILDVLTERYGRGHDGEYFVMVNAFDRRLPPMAKEYDVYPSLVNVVGSNFVHVGAEVDPRAGVIRLVVVLDNLIKGAAGSAVQNFNVLMGLDETAGLRQYAL